MCTAQLCFLTYLRGADDDPELSHVFFGEMLALPYSWTSALRGSLAILLYLRGDREGARREFDLLVANGFETIRSVPLGTIRPRLRQETPRRRRRRVDAMRSRRGPKGQGAG